MSDSSANLSLPYLKPAQAQKHVTHNEALRILDAVVQLVVDSRVQATPPVEPASGARHIVPINATDAWEGQTGRLAVWEGGGWIFLDPRIGWRAFVADEGVDVIYRDTGWVAPTALDALESVGINADADTENRLVVAAGATLFSHEGAGHRLKVDKASAENTASLLFQTGFSGRAEMGTTGSDDFAIKVSADGGTWVTALRIEAASGLASGAAVQNTATDIATGRLARADYVYGPGNLLGEVGEIDGIPTGAVIESGNTAVGDYVRFADGTQICTGETRVDIDREAGSLYASGGVLQDFPKPFATLPSASGSIRDTGDAWANARAESLTRWEVSAFAPLSRSGDAVRLLAIGRWF